FQEKGYNTAAPNTPIYYTADRAVAEVIRVATPVDNLFIAGRMAGAVWLVLGLVLTYLAGRRLGVGRLPLVAVLGLVVAAPATTYASATVTPDALGLASGAAVLLAALRWEQRPTKGRAAALIASAVVVTLIKLTFFAVVPAVALYLLLHRSRSWESSTLTGADLAADAAAAPAGGHTRTIVALATGAAALLAAAGWTLLSNARSRQDPNDLPSMATQFRVDAFPWRGLLDNAFVLAQPLSNPWVGVGDSTLLFFSTNAVSLVLTAGLVAAALFVTHGEREALLARCVLLSAVVFSLGLVALGYLSSHIYFNLPNRYGVALVAPTVVVTASLLRSRTSVALVIGLAVLVTVVSAVRLLGWTGIPPT
ncbi:MAG TPA: glycosyltransferase family 39 protein, partial [Nocardioides sp.]|nr:glycosyltransferase family 39 protein [Nocardioides sp.]